MTNPYDLNLAELSALLKCLQNAEYKDRVEDARFLAQSKEVRSAIAKLKADLKARKS